VTHGTYFGITYTITSTMTGVPGRVPCPIRPIVNWIGAPAYKLAKYLNKLIQIYIPLPNAFNVKSSVYLMDDLLDIPHKQGIKLASFDKENMYPSVPTN
jgi:hypothetical protein